ncbi:Protein of unknown function [Gryllus bimaculatus]|nr:Protein of unknown function [Gryllus bimaculatus]
MFTGTGLIPLNKGSVGLGGAERHVELELGRQLVLGVEAVGEVHAAHAAVGVDLHARRLDVVGAVGAAREVRQVELDLVPAVVEADGHRARERPHARRRLVVADAEAPTHVLVVQDLRSQPPARPAQPVIRSTCHSLSQPLAQPTAQSATHSADHPLNPPPSQPPSRSTTHSANDPLKQSEFRHRTSIGQ